MPSTLRFTPLQTGYSCEEMPSCIEIPLEGGGSRKRQDILLPGHIVNCQWLLSATEYTEFMGFFITELRYGQDDFFLDLITDIGIPMKHVCRTVGGIPKLTQQKGDGYWISATLECDKNPTITDTITYTTQAGPDWTFDGVNDEISFGDNLNKERTDAFSIFGWINSPAVAGCLVGKQLSASATGWRFTASCNFIMVSSTAGQIQVSPNAVPSNNVRHHVGVTYSGSSTAAGVTLWVDNVAVPMTVSLDTLSSGTTVNTRPLQIGRRGTSLPVSGSIEHVTMWDKKLDVDEVSDLYNGGTPPDVDTLSFISNLDLWIKIDVNDTDAAGGVIDYGPSSIDGSALNGLGASETVGNGLIIYPSIARFFKTGDQVQIMNSTGINPDGNVPLNLDGIYAVADTAGGNAVVVYQPAATNGDWETLYDIDPVLFAEYGGAGTGDVLSTVTRIPQ